MSTLIVDADIVAYKLASVSEKPIRWENDVWTLHSDEKDCEVMINDYFHTLKENTECSKIVCAFSDTYNFRTSILPDYKLNRVNTRKPLTLKFCKDYIFENYNGFKKPNLEADDIIGILATTDIIKGSKIICSEDKDLNQIEGLHFNPVTKEFYKISAKQADYNFYFQTLTGDQSDNYKGCPSVGEVKATKILSNSKDYWQSVIETYQSNNLTEDDALIQARVAKILKKNDYDFKLKKVILWSPNKKQKPKGIKLILTESEEERTVFGTKI
jgi:DNA polymerase I